VRVLFVVCLSSLAAFLASAAPQPLTVKEIGLMLRSGYSSEEVMRETAVRRVAESLDSTTEKMLVLAGAQQPLIDALKSGTYASSVEEIAAAREQSEAQARRRAAEVQQSRQSDARYQTDLLQKRSAPQALPARNVIYEAVKGDLVHNNKGVIEPFDDRLLAEKKLFALYFSAHWCAPCRKFTPQLVDFYNRIAPQHPEFELIFFSDDRGQFNMDTYMRDIKMPWPAIDFQKLASKEALKRYAGKSIPCLVLVDAGGRVLSDTYAGETYLGPEKVVADIETLFARMSQGQFAKQP
jgi:nucleoredoxin